MFLRKAARKAIHRTIRQRPTVRPALEPLEDRLCPSGFTVVATGLDNPRGLTFGPDGQLYVAQGGPGAPGYNTLSTTGDPTVQQVPVPIGPYTGGYNSSILRIDPSTGKASTVASGLPSSQTSPLSGGLVSGVADVQFIGGTLYGLEAGAGSSHGLAKTDNTIFRVNPDGTTTNIADLSAFQKANPIARPNADDFEPDGTWYSMVAVRGNLYAVEPNHGELDRITPDGQISRVLDFSTVYGHVVPTAVAYHGNFYVGNLGTFPIHPGSENVYQVTPSGQTQVAASGLTTVVGVAFDAQGNLYALESFTQSASGFPDPSAAGTGEVVRINDDGSLTPVATGLTFPTAMRFGPDGNLYVSNNGYGVPDGLGEIVRINLPSPAADTQLEAANQTSSLGASLVLAAVPGQAVSAFGSPAPLPGRALGENDGNAWAIGMVPMPSVLPAAVSQDVPLSAAMPSAPTLTSNLPPSSSQANPLDTTADRLFARLDAESSLALFLNDLAGPSGSSADLTLPHTRG